MPDPTPLEAAGTPAPTPAIQPATPPSAPASTPDGHVSAEDFAHPLYGTKFKNLHDGLQEKAAKLSKIEKEHQELQRTHGETAQWIQANREALKAFIESRNPQAKPPENNETDDEKRQRQIDELQLQHTTDVGMLEFYAELGDGNITKGRTLYQEKATDLNGVLQQMAQGKPQDHLRMAMEILKARNAVSTPAPQPVLPTLPGNPASEPGRGAPAGTPAPTTISSVDEMLKAAGMTRTDYMAAMGAFGR